jgi:hypothetical protein
MYIALFTAVATLIITVIILSSKLHKQTAQNVKLKVRLTVAEKNVTDAYQKGYRKGCNTAQRVKTDQGYTYVN